MNEITIDSEVFGNLKHDFNDLCNKTISTMLQKDVDTAKITMTVEIHLESSQCPDLAITAYAADRDIIVPQFKHKTVATMQLKNEKAGIVDGSESELLWDEDRHCYVMRPVTAPQLTLFSNDEPVGTFTDYVDEEEDDE